MDDNKLEAKLLKIKALAERGEGGEKEAAIKMYHKLLKKYDIDEKAVHAEPSADAYVPILRKLKFVFILNFTKMHSIRNWKPF